jgi:hypothetical protein
MQCKDIPEAPILEFLLKVERGETCWTPEPEMKPGWGDKPIPHSQATWFWSDEPGGYRPENSVVRAMPEGVSGKLALAKMKAMVRKGLVDGCPCGCRGDFEITDMGRAALGQSPLEGS